MLNHGKVGERREGVTAFSNSHVHEAKIRHGCSQAIGELLAWRRILFELRLIGRQADRYDGAGYGNISARQKPYGQPKARRQFIITGTQTGHLATLGEHHLTLVSTYCSPTNHVTSIGPIRPSSESMTHGAVYDLTPSIRAVFHVHSPVIWRKRAQLTLPTTDASIEYGTPEMAEAVRVMARQTALLDHGCFAMGGHEDGIVSFGRSIEDAGTRLMSLLARAYSSLP